MTALSIATTWLILTAAGFAGLRVLGRVETRKDTEASLTALEGEPIMLADVRTPIPAALLR